MYHLSDGTNFLVDIGLSNKIIIEKLSSMNIESQSIKFVFITHEHQDHIKGLKVFLKNNTPQVYASKGTFDAFDFSSEKFNIINNDIEINSNIKIIPFPISHDANEPMGFKIIDKKRTFIHLTDTGYINSKTKEIIQEAKSEQIEKSKLYEDKKHLKVA